MWVRSFYLGFEKFSLHWAPPFSVAPKKRTCFPHLFVHIFFFNSSFLIRVCFTKPQTPPCKKIIIKIKLVSFYTAILKKNSIFVRTWQKVIFTKFWDKVCFKVIVLRISGYLNHTLGFLLGHSKCVSFSMFTPLVFLCGYISFRPLTLSN